MNTTIKADVSTLLAATEIYTKAIEPLKPIEGLVCSFTLQPYALSLLEQSVAKGGNSLGITPADGPLVSILLLTYWKNKSDDAQILEVLKGALEKIQEVAVEKGTKVDYTYMNYSFIWQDPVGSYGKENVKKLREVSRKFDPEGLFQKGVPGGFKLW